MFRTGRWSEGVAFIVMGAMAATMALGIALSLRLGAGEGYGALAGAATAVCGASATLAMAAVVPNYPAKAADVAFAVIAANAVSTLAMIVYPPLAALFGLDARSSGVLLGATIHDMAQVVGAPSLRMETFLISRFPASVPIPRFA